MGPKQTWHAMSKSCWSKQPYAKRRQPFPSTRSVHCPAPGARPTICLASGKPCAASKASRSDTAAFCDAYRTLPSVAVSRAWCAPPPDVRGLLLPPTLQDGSVWNPKVPLCSTVAPLGAPFGECYTSMQGAALAYANVQYWQAQQASCWNPATCNCVGGTPGKRVLRFVDGTLLDAPCSAANKMGTQPKCQVGARAGCHKQQPCKE